MTGRVPTRMTRFSVMGRKRGGGTPLIGLGFGAAALVAAALGAPAAWADGGAGAVPPAPATTTTLPSLPQIALSYTDGQPAAELLGNAISLASLGVDHTALSSAITATQARLDRDALVADAAEKASEAAARSAESAQARERYAQSEARDMASAVRQAVIALYMAGPDPLPIDPHAGQLALYAADYAESAIGPYGVLAQRQDVERERSKAQHEADRQLALSAAYAKNARKALHDQQAQLDRLKTELSSISAAAAAAVAADHNTLAGQAGQELVSATSLQFAPKTPLPPPLSTTAVALTWAFAELGKEYVWGATGPDTFDCSGLTQFVWKAAGVAIPRVAADQDAWTIPVPLSQLLPGDLVFFGTTDIHHVGIYIGDGLMINAPHTGTVVQVSSIWWSDLAGFGRVHYPGTPVPSHHMPTPSAPARPAVVPTAGPVPSQTKPPAGWKPHPGSTTPIPLGPPATGDLVSTDATSTTTSSTSAPPGDPATAAPSLDLPGPGPTTTTTTVLDPPVSASDTTTTTTPTASGS